MRCYFMRKGHIQAVVILTAGPDEALIEQGKKLFRERSGKSFDGFEVWDGARRLHVHQGQAESPSAATVLEIAEAGSPDALDGSAKPASHQLGASPRKD